MFGVSNEFILKIYISVYSDGMLIICLGIGNTFLDSTYILELLVFD